MVVDGVPKLDNFAAVEVDLGVHARDRTEGLSYEDVEGSLVDDVGLDRDLEATYRTVLPANFYIIIQQMLDSYYNYYKTSTANAAIIVLQFVSISQPSLYHL